MAKIVRLEDMTAWQKARSLIKTIFELTDNGTKFSRDFVLRDQIRRASVSAMINIAIGFARGGDWKSGRFLSIALGSMVEVHSQLYVALDQKYLTNKEFEDAAEAVAETTRLINGFIQYLNADVAKPG